MQWWLSIEDSKTWYKYLLQILELYLSCSDQAFKKHFHVSETFKIGAHHMGVRAVTRAETAPLSDHISKTTENPTLQGLMFDY